MVDFDVHHGNGTQDVLCRTEHPGFLYASIHAFNRGGGDASQAKIFPGTGAAGEAHGNVLNIPLADQVGIVVLTMSLAFFFLMHFFLYFVVCGHLFNDRLLVYGENVLSILLGDQVTFFFFSTFFQLLHLLNCVLSHSGLFSKLSPPHSKRTAVVNGF